MSEVSESEQKILTFVELLDKVPTMNLENIERVGEALSRFLSDHKKTKNEEKKSDAELLRLVLNLKSFAKVLQLATESEEKILKPVFGLSFR